MVFYNNNLTRAVYICYKQLEGKQQERRVVNTKLDVFTFFEFAFGTSVFYL